MFNCLSCWYVLSGRIAQEHQRAWGSSVVPCKDAIRGMSRRRCRGPQMQFTRFSIPKPFPAPNRRSRRLSAPRHPPSYVFLPTIDLERVSATQVPASRPAQSVPARRVPAHLSRSRSYQVAPPAPRATTPAPPPRRRASVPRVRSCHSLAHLNQTLLYRSTSYAKTLLTPTCSLMFASRSYPTAKMRE